MGHSSEWPIFCFLDSRIILGETKIAMKRTRLILLCFGVSGVTFVASALLSTWRSLDQDAAQSPSQASRAGDLKGFPMSRQASTLVDGTGPSIHDQSLTPSTLESQAGTGFKRTNVPFLKERSSALGTTSPLSNAAPGQPSYEPQTPISQRQLSATVDSKVGGISGAVVSPMMSQGNQSASSALSAEGGSSRVPTQGTFANPSHPAGTVVSQPIDSYANEDGYATSSVAVPGQNETYGSSQSYSSNYLYQEQLLKYGVMYGSAALNQAEESAPPQ